MNNNTWGSIGSAVIGLWIMILPALFRMPVAVADNHYIIGPLVITFSIISMWEINKSAIKFNVVPGLWLVVSFFVLPLPGSSIIISDIACAVLIILLSLLKRRSTQRFGGGWRSLFQEHPMHLSAAENSNEHNAH